MILPTFCWSPQDFSSAYDATVEVVAARRGTFLPPPPAQGGWPPLAICTCHHLYILCYEHVQRVQDPGNVSEDRQQKTNPELNLQNERIKANNMLDTSSLKTNFHPSCIRFWTAFRQGKGWRNYIVHSVDGMYQCPEFYTQDLSEFCED
jgi:hypothetical protein